MSNIDDGSKDPEKLNIAENSNSQTVGKYYPQFLENLVNSSEPAIENEQNHTEMNNPEEQNDGILNNPEQTENNMQNIESMDISEDAKQNQESEVKVEQSAPQEIQGGDNNDLGNIQSPIDHLAEGEATEAELKEGEDEAKEEESKAESEYDNSCIQWMLDKMISSNIIKSHEDPLLTDSVQEKIILFLDNEARVDLFMKVDGERLVCENDIRDLYVSGDTYYNFCFFIKKSSANITIFNIDTFLVYDYVYGNLNKSMLDVMNEKYMPYILHDLQWPESIKKELIANFHKFMITLSHTYYSEQKQVVLYIPQENFDDMESVYKDKSLISRLETIMIEWTTQIRDFINNQESNSNTEDFDVLNEINYWELRNMNLTNISIQLENHELHRIIDILEKVRAQNDNLRGFVDLKSKILEEKRKSQDMLKVMKGLQKCCHTIAQDEMLKVPDLLIELLNKIRIITEKTNLFPKSEHVAELLKKVSNQLLHKFTEMVVKNTKNIKTEYSDQLYDDIRLIKGCIGQWKRIYRLSKERILRYETQNQMLCERWTFDEKDYQNIFYDLEAFEKRCQNLEEVCQCQLQFGKDKNGLSPVFGGAKSYEIIKQLKDIEDKFDDQMSILFSPENKVEDIKVNTWQEVFRTFSKHIEDLEDMYKNTISTVFKRVNTLEEAVNYVENFFSMARLPKIKAYIMNEIASDVVRLYSEELENMKIKFETKSFTRLTRQTYEGGNALWTKYLSLKLDDYAKNINRMNLIFNPKKPKEELKYQTTKAHQELSNQIKQMNVLLKSYLLGDHPEVKEDLERLLKVTDEVLDDKLKIPLVVQYDPPSGEKPFFQLYQCNYPLDLLRLYATNNCFQRIEEYSVPPDVFKRITELEENTRPLRENVLNIVREYNNLVLSVKTPIEHAIFQEEFARMQTENINRIQIKFWNSIGNETILNKFKKRIDEVSQKLLQFKLNTDAIQDIADNLSKKTFFALERNNEIVEKEKFLDEQKIAREKIASQISTKAKDIHDLIIKSYKFIENSSEADVFKGFKSYIEDLVEKSEKSFINAVEKILTNSIVNMDRAMLGYGETVPQPFLRVFIKIVEKKFKKENISYECSPSDTELKNIIYELVGEMQKVVNNVPDIIKMFTDSNNNFLTNLEKKKYDERLNRNIVNSMTQLTNDAERKGGKTKSISPDKNKEPPIKKKTTMGSSTSSAGLFSSSKEPYEKEKTVKFPKAEAAKKTFFQNLRGANIEKKFSEKIESWQKSEVRNKEGLLDEKETERTINSRFAEFIKEVTSDGTSINISLKGLLQAITEFKQSLSETEVNNSIPETLQRILFIQFDASQIKQKLTDLCENVYIKSLEYMIEKTRKEFVEKVRFDFNEHEIIFKREPETKEEYKELLDKHEMCVKEKTNYFKRIEAARQILDNIFIVNHIKLPIDDLIEGVATLERRKESYEKLLLDTDIMLKKAREKLADEVKRENMEFIQQIQETKKDFLNNIPDKIEPGTIFEFEQTNTAKKTLESYEMKCKLLKNREEVIKKGLILFKDDLDIIIESNKDLLDLEEQIKNLYKIWDLKTEMNEIVGKWCRTQFYHLNLQEMYDERAKIENDLTTKCKNLRNTNVFNHMKEQLDNYSNYFYIIELLRDDSMNPPQHWEKVQSYVGDNKLNNHSVDFTFEAVVNFNLYKHKDLIEKLVKYAKGQQNVGRQLERIQGEWKKNQLKYEFKDDTFKLLNNDKIMTDLEEHLNKIAETKSTVYYDDFKEMIDLLEIELNKIGDTYMLLIQVMEKWNYLKNVYSKDNEDLQHQAPVETATYKLNNERFLFILRTFDKLVSVRECFLQKNIEKDLNDLLREFRSVERGLCQVLDFKRSNFDRLNFLSNDDFFELLGNCENPKIINFHLSKLFSGIDTVTITTEYSKGKEPRKEIKQVSDALGEVLKLDKEVVVSKVVETWLSDLEKYMRATLERKFAVYKEKKYEFDMKNVTDLDKALEEHGLNGQMLLLITQYNWRIKLDREFRDVATQSKSDINYDNILDELNLVIDNIGKFLDKKKENLSVKNRMILYNYILINKHLTDVTMNLKVSGVKDSENFEWKKILKFAFEKSNKTVKSDTLIDRYTLVAEQLNNKAPYGYEYIGNKERLVISALTERCFLTMMTAISNHRGGSLQGPAGTGKTETVKDLARSLAKYVIVFNCSNKNNYNTMATLFMGILKTGAWCCFDEFNRIEVEVLSVVRIQLTLIFDGLRSKAESIPFKGTFVQVNPSLAIYITMNPTYLFRSELPDNLKTLFRPIAVMMADRLKICEIRFLAEGYLYSNILAQKLVTAFDIMEQQLSRQSHYDFSLRTIISVILHASSLKKHVFVADQTQILKMAIIDMIRPKLMSDDEIIFEAIISCVFNDNPDDNSESSLFTTPEQEVVLRKNIKDEIMGYRSIDGKTLCGSPYLVTQTVQLVNYMKIKHGIMLVGESMSGKSTCLKILQSLNKRLEKKDPAFKDVSITTLYPKSIELDDLYGRTVQRVSDNTLKDGLLPYHLKNLCSKQFEDGKALMKWLVLDGPVDTLWIESLNTVLDETKMLSLPSGYRINLKPDVKIIFEAENLQQATPATVSRVGLIYFEADKLGWFPIARNWLDRNKSNKDWYENIANWFERYVYGLLNELKEMRLNFIFNYHENHIIINLIRLYDSFIKEIKLENENGEDIGDKFWVYAERIFIFSLMWSIAGCLNEADRAHLDQIVRKYFPNFPPHSSIFDYCVSADKDDWGTWEERISNYFPTHSNAPYNEIFVNTLDITRNKTICHTLLKNNHMPFLMGNTGTGKSTVAKMIFNLFESTKYLPVNVNLSYGISSRTLQTIIEQNFDKRNNKLFPPSNKKCLIFIDDLNLPKVDQFGCQMITELLRQVIELEGWYGVDELLFKSINSMVLFGCTSLRGSEKAEISRRFTSKFVPVMFIEPDENNKQKIYQTVLSYYLSSFPSEDIKKLSETLAISMVSLYKSLYETDAYLPTPTKCHYIYTIKDMSKIFESIAKIKGFYYSKEFFVKLWVHECFRTIHDKFLMESDKVTFRELISRQLELNLQATLKDCQFKDGRDAIFVDFISDSYDDITDYEDLKQAILAKVKSDKAFDNMVFFDQAINYICVINRILNKSIGGHGLFIGLGASGRTSYIKIASVLSNFQAKMMNNAVELKLKDWNEFIKGIVKTSGSDGEKIALILRETDFFNDEVIENIHYILTTGLIPNLFSNEDWDEMKANNPSPEIQTQTTEVYINNFRKYCHENIKIFINLSPLGEKLRDYCRLYPSIIDHTTCVYFSEWPESALVEVGHNYLEVEVPEDRPSLINDLADIFSQIHLTVFNIANKMNHEVRRKCYFTSSNYINLIKTFNKYLNIKEKDIKHNIEKYATGLQKIKIGNEKIEIMTKSLEEKNSDELQKTKELEKIIDSITEQTKIAIQKESELMVEREKNSKNQAYLEKNLEDCKRELEEAEKPMREAVDLVNNKLDRSKLAEFKSFNDAPTELKNVFYGLNAIFNRPTTWNEVKTFLQELHFDDLREVSNLQVTERGNMPKIQSFTKDFKLEKLWTQSQTVAVLAQYIIAVEKYFKAKWNVEVKQRNLNDTNKNLREAIDKLNAAENELKQIKTLIDELEEQRKDKKDSLEKTKDETANIKVKLERANYLIFALQGEQTRWLESQIQNENSLKNVLGNTILASACIVYFGIFPGKYREELLKDYWIPILHKKKILYTEKFDLLEFISNHKELEDWKSQGLPNDSVSRENAAIIKYSLVFPLIIDPQDQASKWIKKRTSHEHRELINVTPQTSNYIREIKKFSDTHTIIINNIGESLSMDLDECIKNLEKGKHKLYLMTKAPNPHFMPEVSSRVNIINFLVNETGLEEQLLSEIITNEKRETHELIIQTNDEIFNLTNSIRKAEENILTYLNNATDNYLEDDILIGQLKTLKKGSTDNEIKMTEQKNTMEKIISSKEEYRPLARKASKYFFVLYSMNSINNMYEFSLQSYIELFKESMGNRETISLNESTDERIKKIEQAHRQKIIQFSNQTLFEKDRILFSFRLCLISMLADEEELKRDYERKGMLHKLLSEDNKDRPSMFNMSELKLLLSNNVENIDSKDFHKPNWINDNNAWKFIMSLENHIPDFKGLKSAFHHNSQDWSRWYTNTEIDNELPNDYEAKCKDPKSLRRLLFVKALRPDKFSQSLKSFITRNLDVGDLKKEYSLDLKEILKKNAPLLIIHGSGIDPSESFQKLWEAEDKKDPKKDEREKMKPEERQKMLQRRFYLTTLNQDQLQSTTKDITDAAKVGGWVYIANTHLTLGSIPVLERTLDELISPHPNFRLIISTNPHGKYPISFLQRCEKIVFEVPKGIGINMSRLFEDIQKENIKLEGESKNDIRISAFSKLVFSLSMFHALLIERRKFKNYGWTNFYDFNNSDFNICLKIITSYFTRYTTASDFQWKAIQKLIAINYGSRFTNEKDLKLLNTYSEQFFNSKVILEKNYNFLYFEPPYTIPDDGMYERYKNTSISDPSLINKPDLYLRMCFYKEEVSKFPKDDPPQLFGLHHNAEISSNVQDSLSLIENIRLISSEIVSGGDGISKEETVLQKITYAKNKLPDLLVLDLAKKKANTYDKTKFDPVLYFLIQEADRYNSLLRLIKSHLLQLDNSLKGNTILTPDLERDINSIYEDKVPYQWLLSGYISTKPFTSFINDISARVEFFYNWLTHGTPLNNHYILSYFCNPNGFITTIRQKYAMDTGNNFYQVTLEFKVIDEETKIIPKNGYMIKGIIIEGGIWDKKQGGLRDEYVQELYNPLPILLISPIRQLDEQTSVITNAIASGMGPLKHTFPLYYIPIRGTYLTRPSYVMDINLSISRDKDKESNAEKTDAEYIAHWVKKGTCLLLSKND
jgi:dynein heavy chain